MKLPLKESALLQFNGMEGALEVSGEIIRVVDKLKGEGEYGPWSFQKVTIKDEDGEATLSLKNRDENLTTSEVGKFITIGSNETKKGGHKGVKVENREFKKKDGTVASALEIVVTGHASMEINGSAYAEHDKVVKSLKTVKVEKTTAEEPERLVGAVLSEEERWNALKQLRKETIQETYATWLMTLMESKIELTPEIIAAMIRVCGPNADTLLLSKLGRK